MLCSLCQTDNPAQSQRCCACGAALKARPDQNSAASDALPGGTVLANTYAVEEVLGQGGFGITYRCRDQMLDRRVAVKEFFPSGCRRQNAEVAASRGLSDADFREARAQFLAEARTLARCHHVGIVGVHAAFEANSTAYMVMELLHGKTLAQLLTARGGAMNEAEAIGVIERVGEALQFVHEQNLLHRDIKPDNIIVCDDGRVMLIDFGTARETIQGQVQGHTVVVTPGYAPLEQYAKQAKRGPFTDIYSLAATLYQLLTGQMPPAASDRAMGVQLRAVREFKPQISPAVAAAVERALQMEIARRPQCVREFLDLLHAPVEQAEVEAFFHPQLAQLLLDEDDKSNGAIPAEIYAAALRARQQMIEGATPTANTQPVKLAPPHEPVARVAAIPQISGGVGIQNLNESDPSMAIMWWGAGGLVALVVLMMLLNASVSPPVKSPTYGSSIAVSSNDFQREEAINEWQALPALQPFALRTLPGGEAKDARKLANWHGVFGFSSDGQCLATIDSQFVLRVFKLPNRQLVRTLDLGQKFTPYSFVFSPDNQILAVTQMDNKEFSQGDEYVRRVVVWNVRTGEQLGAFSPASRDEYVWPWAVTNEAQILLKTGPLSPSGPEVKGFLWNPATGNRSATRFPDFSRWDQGVASPDGREFVLVNDEGQLRWLNFRTGAQKAKYSGGPKEIRNIDYSLNGSYLASRSNNEIQVFNSQPKLFASLRIDAPDSTVTALSPDGKWLAARGALPLSPTGNILWNVRTNQKTRLQTPSNNVIEFGFSPNGKQLYGVFGKGDKYQFVIWKPETPKS